jgi:pyrimidine operon attenuation protein / uracil phosphoribosyltransferase
MRGRHESVSESPPTTTEVILDPAAIEDVIGVLAEQIAARHPNDPVALVGIFTRGVILSQRLGAALAARGFPVPVGTLDTSLYRDDFDQHASELPRLNSSDISFVLDGSTVILCDEVIYTGRTIRAALDGLMDYGRPAKIELAVLVDRGHRELPIQPDYTGHTVSTTAAQYVKVYFSETDTHDEGVFLLTPA